MPILADLVRVQMLSTLESGQGVANTVHVVRPGHGVPSNTELAALAADWQTWFSSAYRLLLNTGATWNSISCFQVPDPTAPTPPGKYTLNLNLAGTRTAVGTKTPQSACAVMSIQSALATKKYRSHLMLPPALDPAQLNGDIWDTTKAYYLNSVALAAKFAAGSGASPTWTGTTLSNYFMANFSKSAGLAGLPSYAVPNGVLVRTKVAWLRSRERGTS